MSVHDVAPAFRIGQYAPLALLRATVGMAYVGGSSSSGKGRVLVKAFVAILLLASGVPITLGTARWWWRKRRADDYWYGHRNIALSLGGIGIGFVVAGVRLLQEVSGCG